jgi:RalA-binding protein 1
VDGGQGTSFWMDLSWSISKQYVHCPSCCSDVRLMLFQRGGPRLGSISILNAQIGRQNRPSEGTDERDFRHAFLIIEASRRGMAQRHVLCAESDVERDNWIEALVKQVDPEPIATAPSIEPSSSITSTASVLTGNAAGLNRKRSTKQSRDVVVVTAAQPIATMPSADSKFGGAPSPSLINSLENQRVQQAVSSGSTPSLVSSPTQASFSDGNLSTPASSSNPLTVITSPSSEILSSSPPVAFPFQSAPTPRARGNKRQSMIPTRSNSGGKANSSQTHSAAYLSKIASEGLSAIPGLPIDKDRERKAKSGRFWPSFNRPAATPEKPLRPVFGVSLVDSIAIASVANLPAIVFRCIEYLEANKAETEEGLYRLSGSSAVIKGLKDRFDVEGDVRLLEVDLHWDPHAIAGLLKTFLRELPISLLTRDLHPRFLAVMGEYFNKKRGCELTSPRSYRACCESR